MSRNKKNDDLVVVKDDTSDTLEKATGVLTVAGLLVSVLSGILEIIGSGKNTSSSRNQISEVKKEM